MLGSGGSGVLFLVWAVSDGGPWWGLLTVEAVFAVPFGLAFRSYRAGIYVSRTAVRVRTLARTRTLPWGEVAEIGSEPYRRIDRPDDPRRSDAIFLVLRAGQRVRTPVRILNPYFGRKAYGPLYDRPDILRFMAQLRDRIRS